MGRRSASSTGFPARNAPSPAARITAGLLQSITGNVQAKATGTTTATIWWHAPDSVGCWVDYSSDGGTTWSAPVQAAATARRQSLNLTGLVTATHYDARVRCYGSAKTAHFQTR